MASCTFTGVIRQISEVTTIQLQSKLINKREVLLETVEEFPERLYVELYGENATAFSGFEGQIATAYLKFSVGKSETTGRHWTNIKCWKIEFNR